MATTTFVDQVTVIEAEWLNEVDALVHDIFSGATTASAARTNLGVAIGSDVQAHSAVLDATTASFTTADETKLDAIEALADVTDETNVTAALDGASLTAATIAVNDKVLIQDTDGSDELKTVTTQAIADLANIVSLGTEQASTSGTAIDFTSIASGAKQIHILLDTVSTSGTSDLLVQIGDSGGIEATGYSSGAQRGNATDHDNQFSTAGYLLSEQTSAAYGFIGILSLYRMDTSNTWVSVFNICSPSTTNVFQVGTGIKTLSGELDRVRITTVGGSDTFDAGAINIQVVI